MEKMIAPLQDKIEEWKKTAALLDKDHAKGGTDSSQLSISKPGYTCCTTNVCEFTPSFCSSEYKRSRQEIKKKSSDTIKLQKKARKGQSFYSLCQRNDFPSRSHTLCIIFRGLLHLVC